MRILATAAFAFAAGVFSTQVLPEGGWVVFSGTPGTRFVLSLTADEEK